MPRYLISFPEGSMPFPDEAEEWAARIAAACRCAQEVREIMDDPES